MLGELEKYVNKRNTVKVKDVALHFDVSPEMAEQMLEFLTTANKVKRVDIDCGQGCGNSCGSIEPSYQAVQQRVNTFFN
jgi:hypothetical protein